MPDPLPLALVYLEAGVSEVVFRWVDEVYYPMVGQKVVLDQSVHQVDDKLKYTASIASDGHPTIEVTIETLKQTESEDA